MFSYPDTIADWEADEESEGYSEEHVEQPLMFVVECNTLSSSAFHRITGRHLGHLWRQKKTLYIYDSINIGLSALWVKPWNPMVDAPLENFRVAKTTATGIPIPLAHAGLAPVGHGFRKGQCHMQCSWISHEEQCVYCCQRHKGHPEGQCSCLTSHLTPPPADSISLFEEEEMRMVRRVALMAPGESPPGEGLIPEGKMRLYSSWQMIRRKTNAQWQSKSHRQKTRAKAKMKKWKAKAAQPESSAATASTQGLESLD
jgi:hypothetical protein